MRFLPFRRFQPNKAIESGTLEALKWLAVASMTIDHVNRHLLGGAYIAMMQIGRLAMPMFILILAYNLARPETRSNGTASRVFQRLILFAVLSSLPYMELNLAPIGWRPLNILFTLAAGTAFVILMERPTLVRQFAAIALFGISGALVDYEWAGLGIFVCGWQLFRSPSLFWGASLMAFMVLRGIEDHTQWYLAALPVIGLGFYVRIKLPRWRNALYYYYPIHLVVIIVLKIMIFENV